ncbi:unnamed protein product [Prorocentrum cordatum]|uniref:RNA-directed RNA polymerase n=1 Tax=Prorocentrum cordatum TaxID=2364126 RepID=A0ABN9VDC8_9DINO|nr:unnamed protein product [Polarella glacialis]
MRQFQRAGAEIVEATGLVVLLYMKLARVLGILHADGSGSMEANTLGIVEELEYDSELLQMVSDRLQTLNYRSTHSDPMLPSIARFWFDNMLGELVAYPTLHAISSATDMLRKPRIQWNVGRGDLAFVFPVARRNKTASTISRYGNSSCAAKAKGGGPFIVNDSPYLAEEVLRRMGYMDDTRNADLDEAVDAFLGTTRNRRELRKIGIQIELSDTTQDKLAKIRHVCLSSSCTGELSVPPSDDAVRQFLAARGFIDSATSSDDIQGAMDAFVRKSGVSPKRSYNGLVGQCLDISTGRLEDPTRRP